MSKSRPDEDETPRLPIPEQVVSNGEFLPRPPSPKQKRIAALTHELAEHRARQLGMKRRDFLRTAAGSATMMLAMNHVYGCDSGRSGGATPSPSATATASPTAVPFNICDEDARPGPR